MGAVSVSWCRSASLVASYPARTLLGRHGVHRSWMSTHSVGTSTKLSIRSRTTRMRGEQSRGLLDTNILIPWQSIEPAALPEDMAISAVTQAELSAGVHLVSDS